MVPVRHGTKHGWHGRKVTQHDTVGTFDTSTPMIQTHVPQLLYYLLDCGLWLSHLVREVPNCNRQELLSSLEVRLFKLVVVRIERERERERERVGFKMASFMRVIVFRPYKFLFGPKPPNFLIWVNFINLFFKFLISITSSFYSNDFFYF